MRIQPITDDQLSVLIHSIDYWGSTLHSHGWSTAAEDPAPDPSPDVADLLSIARAEWVAAADAVAEDTDSAEQLITAIDQWGITMQACGRAAAISYFTPPGPVGDETGRAVFAADDTAQVARLVWAEPLVAAVVSDPVDQESDELSDAEVEAQIEAHEWSTERYREHRPALFYRQDELE